MKKSGKISWISASSFVVANMIGTGVFTSLGFQLLSIESPISILILWGLGGIIALCGALVYSELGSAMPRSGGEYHYLSVLYGPSVGFLSGWVSLIVGFAAPVALACMAAGKYLCVIFPALHPTLLPIAVLTVITILHSFSIGFGTKFQNVLTILKLAIILVFITAGLITADDLHANPISLSGWSPKDIFNPGFAVALIWVYYSFSGWNASSYIASDIENPKKNIPRSLLASTIFVSTIYVLLNYIFLRSAPISDMKGSVEIGLMCANNIFGGSLGAFIGIIIACILLSSISSMVFIGPRVSCAMGEDHKIFSPLAHKNKSGCPTAAIWLQYSISLLMILTDSFELVTEYTGILLSVFGLLTVFGIFIHRKRTAKAEKSTSYKVFAYPLPPIIFCALMIWTISYMVYMDIHKTCTGEQNFTWMTALSTATIVVGYIIYLIDKRITNHNTLNNK